MEKTMITKFAFALLSVALSGSAMAQAWPSKPVRMIVNVGAGVAPDVVLRYVSDRLSTKLGRPFVVDNVPGGGGVTASNAMAQAAPDGYTFLLAGVGIAATDRHMFKSLPYDPDKDFAAVGVLYDSTPFGLAVNVDLPVKTVPDLIALAKSQPGKLSYGSEQAGVQAVTGPWFTIRAGIDMTAVPYKTPAQMFPDLMANRIQMLFGSFGQLLPYHASGKMRMIGITREKRLPSHPDFAAIAETLPGFRVAGIGIVFAPARTPADIDQKMNAELDAIVKEPEYQKRLGAFGFTNLGTAGTPGQIAQFMKSERDNWDTVFKSVKIEPQ
jgi:tripartite-type tricarboxylate transporter receptor subunit TctC